MNPIVVAGGLVVAIIGALLPSQKVEKTAPTPAPKPATEATTVTAPTGEIVPARSDE